MFIPRNYFWYSTETVYKIDHTWWTFLDWVRNNAFQCQGNPGEKNGCNEYRDLNNKDGALESVTEQIEPNNTGSNKQTWGFQWQNVCVCVFTTKKWIHILYVTKCTMIYPMKNGGKPADHLTIGFPCQPGDRFENRNAITF